jgi:hypothetical protein
MADKPANNTNANVPDVAKQQAIAENSQVGKQRLQSSVPKRLYLAREPNVPPTNRSLASDAQQALIGKWQNREGEFGSLEQQVLAQVVGLPRPPNSAEAANLNAMISTPAAGSRGFEYIKFRTLSQSPTTSLPSEDLFLPGSYKEMMISGLLPEAWYQAIGDEGSYTSGDLIMIAYGDPINHLDPYIVQNTGGGEGTLTDLNYADLTPSGIKASFYNGTTPKENIFDRSNSVRDLSKITEFIIHETVNWSAASTIGTLLKREKGVHYILSEDAKIYKTGGWDKILAHAGGVHNSRAIGVEVVSPFYGAVYKGPHAADVATYWPIPPIRAPWAHYNVGQEQTYLLPSEAQFESTWQLTLQITSSPLINVPLKFLGLDKANNRFVITGLQNYRKAKGPGIYAHSYIGHSDGAVLVLYCYLRSKFGVDKGPGLEPAVAFNLVRELVKATNLHKTPTNYWADLNLIPNFNDLVATSFVPEQAGTELG